MRGGAGRVVCLLPKHRWILKKYCLRLCTELSWLRIGSVGEVMYTVNKLVVYHVYKKIY